MDLQSAKCELRNPPGVGFGLLLFEGLVLVGLTFVLALWTGA